MKVLWEFNPERFIPVIGKAIISTFAEVISFQNPQFPLVERRGEAAKFLK